MLRKITILIAFWCCLFFAGIASATEPPAPKTAPNHSAVCFQAPALIAAAYRDAQEIPIGGGDELSELSSAQGGIRVIMLLNRENGDWSFLSLYEKGTACFLRGGTSWTMYPFVLPEKITLGTRDEKRIGKCSDASVMKTKLSERFGETLIGSGKPDGIPLEGFPGNSKQGAVKDVLVQLFVSASSNWTAVSTMTYANANIPPRSCIEAFGSDWLFEDYYGRHLK